MILGLQVTDWLGFISCGIAIFCLYLIVDIVRDFKILEDVEVTIISLILLLFFGLAIWLGLVCFGLI